MRKNKLKKRLNFNVPEYDAEAFEKTVSLAKAVDYGIENHRMTEMQSIYAQVKFIPLRTWLIKIVIALFLNVGILLEMEGRDANLWIFMSISIPLLCLAGTNEICNMMQPDLKDLLMTVRYSLRKIILIRLILFGITDFVILLFSILCAYLLEFQFGWNELLYILALYEFMCAGCMYILNHTKEPNAIFSCAAWGGSLAIMNLIIKSTFSEALMGKENVILFLIILLSVWKISSEVKIMLGGLQQSEIRG